MELSQEEKMREGVSVYLDDIYVNKDIVLPVYMRTKLAKFGLICKDPKWLENGACVLGLDIHEEQGTLVPELPDILTRHAVFSLCGWLVGHLPVCRWLHIAASTIKQWANAVTKGCDDKMTHLLLVRIVMEIIVTVKQNDPIRGDWCMLGNKMNIWIDARSLVIGNLLKKDKAAIEDACWSQPIYNATHINLAELDTVLKGITLVLL